MNIVEINPLVLAYLGDAIYELHIREYLITKGISNVNNLQKEAITFVSAKSQSKILEELINKDLLSDEEMNIVKRARNTKITSHPKNASIIEYRCATGLEALIGYLYLENNNSRIKEIMGEVFKIC